MTTKNHRWLVGCICGAAALVSGLVNSQTSNGDPPDNDIGGNDSPSGVSGGFNGMVNTACAYDPYTGNARRVVDDIVVPGTLGAYPLKWTRYYNSRDPDVGNALGLGWRHSYMWSEDYAGADVVRFPDGREVDFEEASGISERLPRVGQLILADGGQVLFDPVTYNLPNGQYIRYRAARIIDPYGLTTTISYDTIGTDENGNDIYRISRITEPGGRYLLLNYSAADGTQISGVQAFTADNNLTQSVSYAYSYMSATGGVYTTLTGATYSDGTVAQYTYQNDNSGKSNAPKIPLLQTCDDVRYSGPMHQIQYLFVTGDRIRGKIKSELKPGSGEAVSTLTFPANRVQTRVETRGDGPKRTFSYDAAGRLTNYTDFKNSTSIATKLTYDGAGFIGTTTSPGTDAGDNTTTYTNEPNIGQLMRITHPDNYHIDFEYTDSNNPYYLFRKSDERASYVGDPQHSIRYDRDRVTHRVTQINYPDGGIEAFWYTDLGQVRTHQRRNGAYEHFSYDAKGRLTKIWNPTASGNYPPAADMPYVSIYYYESGPWADRIFEVLDQRWNPTFYEYDRDAASQPCAGRGLVTRVTHGDGTYISFVYDQFGNVIAAENELRKRTNYAYDDFNRVITVSPPAPAGAMNLTYERAGTADSYLHTARAVHLATDGAGVTVEKQYDANFRMSVVIQQDGTDSPPTTIYEYWPVGLLKTVHDPRNYAWTTTSNYTSRNQPQSIRDALNHLTTRHYDPAGNVDYIDRPDNKRVNLSYDEMNRVQSMSEPATDAGNKLTTFTYWPSDKVRTVQDDNGQITTFEYDSSDLQTRMVYPDQTSQQWKYDEAKNLIGRWTVGGAIQRFSFDARNRVDETWWEATNVVDSTYYDYDAANQLINARNQNGTIFLRYDDAGRLLTEEQNVYGLGSKTVTYASDGAGKRTALGIATTDYQFAYHYDTLGRLDQILNTTNTANGPSASLWFQYSYDEASNQTQRYCPMNGVAQIYNRDELGRIGRITIQKATEPRYGTPGSVPGVHDPGPIDPNLPPVLGLPSLLAGLTNLAGTAGAPVPTVGTIINLEDYTYDAMSRVTQISRQSPDEEFNPITSQDTYTYDYSGQLTSGTYTAWSWNPAITRSVSYAQDKLGNRSQVNDNGNSQAYSRNGNYLNQYVSGPAGVISNGSDHEVDGYAGINYSYIGDQRLASASGNGNTYNLGYDALGRCVRRTLNGTTTYYTYDGPHPIYEWQADGTKAGWNLYGQDIDEILLRADYVILSSGQGYFFQQDHLGSAMLMTGFAGEPVEAYRYEAFGSFTYWNRGVLNNRFKFTGREYQEAFGIYEYRNRVYHTGLGRFLSEDPIAFTAGDSNLFRYCGADPINKKDPNGTDVIVATYDIPGAPVDHIGIGVFYGNPQTAQTWGFNPDHFSLGLFAGQSYRSSVSPDPIDRRTDYVVLGTTPEQDAILMDFIDFVRANPDVFSYNLYGSNCGSFFVENALARIGIYVRRATIPNNLMHNVRQSPHARGNNNGTGGSGGGGETGSPNTASSGTPGLTTQITVGLYLNTTFGSAAYNAFVAAFPNALVVAGTTSSPSGGMSPAAFRDGHKIRMKH
jgi:RHS repeat-associated protein